MSWLNGELILNGMSKKDLAYAHDYIRSTVRNNGDTEEFPNLGENLLPIVQRKIIFYPGKIFKDTLEDMSITRRVEIETDYTDGSSNGGNNGGNPDSGDDGKGDNGEAPDPAA